MIVELIFHIEPSKINNSQSLIFNRTFEVNDIVMGESF